MIEIAPDRRAVRPAQRDGPKRGPRGFSLLEMGLVIAILAIVAALAAPRYNDALNRYRADCAARRIIADLALAQARARAASASRTVAFDVALSRYQIVAEKDLRRTTETYTVDLTAEPYCGSIGTATFGASTTLVYNGHGVPLEPGMIRIHVGDVTRTIAVDADSGVAALQ